MATLLLRLHGPIHIPPLLRGVGTGVHQQCVVADGHERQCREEAPVLVAQLRMRPGGRHLL